MRLQMLMSISVSLMTGSEFSVMKRETSSIRIGNYILKKLNFDYFTQVNVCDRTVLETKESK